MSPTGSAGSNLAAGDDITDGAPGTMTTDGTKLPDLYPFEPQPAKAYVNKIKTLFLGVSADANEIALGENDAGLATLVDGWMATQAYQQTLMEFFMLAFQTSLFDMETINVQVPYGNHGTSAETFMLRESIPRTALDLVMRNRPFNEIANTNRFMVTPRLLSFISLIDQFGRGTDGNGDYYLGQHPDTTFVFSATGGGTDLDDVTNPKSPNFLKFRWGGLKAPVDPGSCVPDICMQNCGQVTITPGMFTYSRGANIWDMLQGRDFIYYVNGNYCLLPNNGGKPFVDVPGYNDWRLVTIRTPKPGEEPTPIYDVTTFRKADEVVFRIPRVGFFTSPAFLGQWPTNVNNEARTPINQTMIVGLNRVFDGSDQTMPLDLRSLTKEHAAPNTPCYGCHLTMDPMRQYFLSALGTNYHPQLDEKLKALPGSWAQQGVTATGGGLQQLGDQIASDPGFAQAWVMKSCAWVNSAPCDERDPEIARIAKNFSGSQFNFNAMMRDLLLSPLTTYKTTTLTATQRGQAPTMARRNQLCRIFAARSGVGDACNTPEVSRLLSGFPVDGFSRATTLLAQPRSPSLVTRVVTENICSYLSLAAVDNRGAFSSQNPKLCIDGIMRQLMGLQPDAEPEVLNLLTTHFDGAKALGLSATDAMRSTFVLACMSPQVITIGQ